MLFIQRITTMARLKNAMKKVESRPFKRQLLELRARLRGDVNAMADAVFSDSGGAGAGSTSNHMADVGTDVPEALSCDTTNFCDLGLHGNDTEIRAECYALGQ